MSVDFEIGNRGVHLVSEARQRSNSFPIASSGQMARISIMYLASMLVMTLFAMQVFSQDMEVAVETSTDTPLMLAASIGDVQAVHNELAKGTNVDERNALGFTAAHQAVIYTHLNALEEVSNFR